MNKDISTTSRWVALPVLAAAFLVLYQPWNLGMRELFWDEGLYAVAVSEFGRQLPLISAHDVPLDDGGNFLFVMIGALLSHWGLPIAMALRLWSVLMVAAGSVVVYFAAASQRSRGAGVVAAAMFFGTILMVDTGVSGYPLTTTAVIVSSAQLLFFYYGARRSSWNRAWIAGLGLCALGFLSGGIWAVVCCVFPMIFLRRPLSVKSKFGKIGFPIGAGLLVAVVVWQAWSYYNVSHSWPFSVSGIEVEAGAYFASLVLMTVEFFAMFMPWSLVIWIPFCVALQTVDETPIFSRYLRTLVVADGLLIWLCPGTGVSDFIMIAAPLSVLVGITYELAMRRYAWKMRWVAAACAVGMWLLAALLLAGRYLPESWIDTVASISLTLEFRNGTLYTVSILLGVALLTGFGVWIWLGRRSRPVWQILLSGSVAFGIVFWTLLQPYRTQNRVKSQFGAMLAKAIVQSGGADDAVIYKGRILGLYGELFYSGHRVCKINSIGQLPEQAGTVYLLYTEFPQRPDRDWSNLLPADYTFKGKSLGLWKGVKRPPENYSSEDDISGI